MVNIIVKGGAYFDDYDLFRSEMDKVISQYETTDGLRIVSGSNRRVENLARMYCEEKHIPIVEYIANWNEYGKRAGYYRDMEIFSNTSNISSLVIIFYDKLGKTKAMNNFIHQALKYSYDIRIISIARRNIGYWEF